MIIKGCIIKTNRINGQGHITNGLLWYFYLYSIHLTVPTGRRYVWRCHK